MRFSWLDFVKRQKIPYVTNGSNVSRGKTIAIKCPWCGAADPSEHLGLFIKGPPKWGCLRNASHRGGDPTRLVRQLLHCSAEEAQRLVSGVDAPTPTLGEHEQSFRALKLTTSAPLKNSTQLKIPKEFKPLMNGSPFAVPFIEYLIERGYRRPQIEWLAKNYKLYYCTTGRFAYRIIIPIFDRYGDLLSWTARSIQADATPRYKTLRVTTDEDFPDAPVAKLPANHTVLGLPVLWSANNSNILVAVEGPFDALKLTAFGHSIGLYATALFGLNIYNSQVEELQELCSRFPYRYLLLDPDAELQRLRLMRALAPLGFKALRMPPGIEDPGDMTPAQVVNFGLSLGV